MTVYFIVYEKFNSILTHVNTSMLASAKSVLAALRVSVMRRSSFSTVFQVRFD